MTGVLIGPIVLLAFVAGVVVGRRFFFQANLGEALVANAIAKEFRRPHVLLNNVTLQTGTDSTQIDHLLIADSGIFVLETKHYRGWIFGQPGDSHWTQVIYRRKSRVTSQTNLPWEPAAELFKRTEQIISRANGCWNDRPRPIPSESSRMPHFHREEMIMLCPLSPAQYSLLRASHLGCRYTSHQESRC